MPSTYTLNNGIELIATGEQSGTWGDTTNTNLELLDTALDGQVTVTLASAGSSGSPNTLPISDGATSNGRNRMVIFNDSSDLGATAYVQLTPNDAEKIMYIRNSLSGDRSILLFQGTYSASNDYELKAGKSAVIYFDGAGSGAVAANVLSDLQVDALAVDTDTLYVDATNDRVGINQDTPLDPLHIKDTDAAIRFEDSSVGITGYSRIFNDNNNAITIDADAGNNRGSTTITMKTDGTSAMVIDSSQRVLIKQTSDIATNSSMLQVFSTGAEAAVNIHRGVASSGAGYLQFQKSRNTTAGSYTIVSDGDSTGNIIWRADDGTAYDSEVAWISAVIDGTPGANDTPGRLVFRTTADGAATSTERMRINNAGDVGIGGARDPDTPLHIYTTSTGAITPLLKLQANVSTNDGSEGASIDFVASGDNTAIGSRIIGTRAASGGNMDLRFHTARDSFAMLIDTSKRVLIGHTSALTSSLTPRLQVVGTDASSSAVNTFRFGNTAFPPYYQLTKSRSTSAGSFAIVQAEDSLGQIRWMVDDGTNYSSVGASIESIVDTTPSANDTPARLVFSTTADGSSSPTERMRINNAGTVIINPNLTSGYTPLIVKGARSSATTLLSLETDGTGQNDDTINLDFKMNSGADSTERVAGRIGVQNVTTGAARGRLIFSVLEDAGNLIEAMRIDDDGEVLIGSTSATNSVTPLNLKGSASGVSGNNFVAGKHGDSNFQPAYTTVRSRGTEASPTSVADADGIAAYNSYGYDGNSYIYTGGIQMFVDGTPGTNDMPSRIGLYTTSDGASSASERMRINSVGAMSLSSSGYVKTNAAQFLTIGDGASASGAGLDIIRGEALSGGTGPVIKMYHGPDSGTQVEQRIASVVGDLIISADHQNAHSGTTMDFHIDGSRKFLVNGTGQIVFDNSGSGLKFAGSSSTLDDYEQGTFSPFFGRGSAFTNEVVQNATYTKVGRLCYINLRVNWTGTDNSGNSLELELPFSCINATNGQIGTAGSMFYSGTSLKSGAAIVPHVATGQNDLTFYSSAGGSFSNLSRAEVNGSYDFVCNMVYEVQ